VTIVTISRPLLLKSLLLVYVMMIMFEDKHIQMYTRFDRVLVVNKLCKYEKYVLHKG